MRLLSTKTLELQEFSQDRVPNYATLSHRWREEEVSFQSLEQKTWRASKGGIKLLKCCERAREDGYDWVWIDTCCIDKTSSAELSEAINSMYTWYSKSSICYAYLEDIESSDTTNLKNSEWFSRGWTLQELIAPRRVIFLDNRWKEFGTKTSLATYISPVTGIPLDILLGKSPLFTTIAQRMSWASKRQTTREEDIAYCLMGLFDIHMPPIYGEGSETAFLRLQEEILRRNSDQTLFLWS
ncbi:HET-domain-containing protein, partial [Amniculicola lignicola CBS 123094]